MSNVGQIIDDKYQIVRQLGQGGMGAVYEARHLGTGRRVAVKVIVSSLVQGADVLARFQREARASGAIESQHVVQVLDSGVDSGSNNPYMVMEHLSGEDVHQLIARVGPVSLDLAVRIVAQACLGLARAHEAGVIHRDIKTANLFLSRRDNGEIIVKVLDFGIAKVRADQYSHSGDHALTRTGSMMGSPIYMSPEQAMGLKDIDCRTDIWSLGVVLHELLTGVTPHGDCDTVGQLIVAICSGKFTPVQDRSPWVPSDLADVVHKAMAREPAHRYQTASEMYGALAGALNGDVKIHESMLVGISQQTRATIAARSKDAPTPVLITSDPGASPFSATTAGTTASDVQPPTRKRSYGWVVGAAAVIAVAAGVVAIALHKPAAAHDVVAERPAPPQLEATALPNITPTAQPVADAAAPVERQAPVASASATARRPTAAPSHQPTASAPAASVVAAPSSKNGFSNSRYE